MLQPRYSNKEKERKHVFFFVYLLIFLLSLEGSNQYLMHCIERFPEKREKKQKSKVRHSRHCTDHLMGKGNAATRSSWDGGI